MISVLAQERLLGAALGSVFAGIVVFEQRKSIYRLISENQHQSVAQSQLLSANMNFSCTQPIPGHFKCLDTLYLTGRSRIRLTSCVLKISPDVKHSSLLLVPPRSRKMTEPLFGKKSSSNVAHIWNKSVDQTLGSVIASLSSRRW